jgi:uncharacterized protein YfaS (alpha-2-macroglobulin family)
VVGDRLWLSKTVSAGADGATVELPIPAEWGPGVYIAATAFRPADSAQQRGPGRAIGVAWVGLDPAPRTLTVTLDAPTNGSRARPWNCRLRLPDSTPASRPG